MSEVDPTYEAHAEIAKSLQHTYRSLREQQREAEQLARDLEKRLTFIRSAVDQGQWWLLEDYLEESQIDLLCEVEPTPTSTLLSEPWE